MLKVTSIFTRPSPDIEINGGVTPDVWDYINIFYVEVNPPKYLSVLYEYNGTTVTIVTLWDSIDSRNSFLSDEWLIEYYHTPRKAYNEANGITEITTIEEIPEDDPYVIANMHNYMLLNHPDGKTLTYEIVQL